MNVKVKSGQSNRNPGMNQQPAYQQPRGRKKPFAAVIVAIIILVVAVAAILLWQYRETQTSSADIKKDQFQAVFLANGQVYFGNMSKPDSNYVKLTNIYYLQVQQAVQPARTEVGKEPQVSLTKLGQELHGPEDEMHISREQVLFWENLKNDSTVVKAIKENEAKNN